MGETGGNLAKVRKRIKKSARREQILLELKLRPHVRISEMAERFGVSAETVRRDMDKLSRDGLINRAHGGASAAIGHYPDLDQRSRDRKDEREAIGRRAAELVQPGDTVMIDSGSTTVQLARFLAAAETPCTVVTNSLAVAMTLGQSPVAEVILCPGDYMASEAAVVGADTIEFLERHRVDRCLIGASGLTESGVSETVRGFAAIKRTMLERSGKVHLLIDCGKFGQSGLVRVARLDRITSVVSNRGPEMALGDVLADQGIDVMVAA
ncbi:MAG: DeoR/GlpR transcriptional regulator [Rhodobacteraceae bacterium]|nr:DeoR/GlpR transcriptional regulator [Paracoccaceae bacterium]